MTVSRRRVLRVYHSAVVTAWRRREGALRDLGLAVTTVSPRRWNEGGRDVPLEAVPGEDVAAVRTFGRHPFRFAYEPVGLWRALRRARPDVLDIHEEPASLAAFETFVIGRLAGVRAPFCLYSAQNLTKRYPPPFRWMERFMLRRAAAVHTCNDEAGRVLRAKGFSGPVVNLGLGVDVELYRRAAADVALRAGRGDAGGALVVGYLGRLTAQKGVDVLVRAVATLPEVVLHVFGSGPDEAALRRLADEVGCGERATFGGHVAGDEVPATLAALDVLVVPSLDTPGVVEQFGRVVVEAQAAGTAVVVSDSGSLPSVGGDAAVVVAQGDVDALAKALDALAADRADLARRSEAGPASAERFAWPAIASRQADLYDRVAGAS